MTVDALLDAIPLPAWIHDVETREVLAANDAFVALTGHPREGLIGMPVIDLCAPSERRRAELVFERLMATPEGELTHPAPFRLLVQGGGSTREVGRWVARRVRFVGRARMSAAKHRPSCDEAIRGRLRVGALRLLGRAARGSLSAVGSGRVR